MMPFPGAPHAVPAGQGQAVPGDQVGQIERLDLGQRPVKDGGQIGHHVFGANSSIMAVIILRSEDDMKKPHHSADLGQIVGPQIVDLGGGQRRVGNARDQGEQGDDVGAHQVLQRQPAQGAALGLGQIDCGDDLFAAPDRLGQRDGDSVGEGVGGGFGHLRGS
jgi:hypothetical protein